VKKTLQLLPRIALSLIAALTYSSVTHAQISPRARVYEITPEMSKIAFYVQASVRLDGNFEKWNAALAFTSTNPSTGLLNIKIRADSVNTGSTRKDDKLKGKDCFDVEEYPYITFQSTKIVQTGLHSFDVPGTFTMRGISKTETLTFTADREGEGTGEIQGTLWFDRKDFGLGGHVHFETIADRVELIVDFKANRISGSPLLFKQ
jgi:polyisoprenoid-binding protein YceI